MQHQRLAMLKPNLTQSPMNLTRIFLGKRWLFGFLKILGVNLLRLLPRVVFANAIHGDSMRNRIQPRPQRAGIFQFPHAAKDPDPYLLQHVERTVRAAGEAGSVVEQWPLHHRDQVLECARLARLATQRKPLVLDSIFAVHVRSLHMSNEALLRFNLRGNFYGRKKGRSHGAARFGIPRVLFRPFGFVVVLGQFDVDKPKTSRLWVRFINANDAKLMGGAHTKLVTA